MLSTKMLKALNEQINAELHSSYVYLALSAYFSDINLDGFASWMRGQAQEEVGHAMKFFDYVVERGGQVKLTAIDAPKATWKSPLEGFSAAHKHEQYITGRIHSLVDLAGEEKDYATANFLQWFVTEQVEEEQSVGNVVEKIRMVADSSSGLFFLDRELAKRGSEE